MRIEQLTCLILMGVMISCDVIVPPNPLSGRYYGNDSIYFVDKDFEDTLVSQEDIFLDIQDLGNNTFDVFNNNGYWTRNGELVGNKIKVNISPFEGQFIIDNDSILFQAAFEDGNIKVEHNAILTR